MGAVLPLDSLGKFTNICQFKEINAKKFKKKKRAFILIAKDVFVVLAVIGGGVQSDLENCVYL